MTRLLDALRIGPARGPLALRVAVLASLLLVSGVFLRAGVPKIQDPAAFALLVYQYQALPELGVNPVALFLPWLEVVCGLALLAVPRWRPAACLLILLMLVGFTGLMLSVIARGIELSCGCFSVDPAEAIIGWRNVARNLGLLAVTSLAWFGSRRQDARSP